MNITRLEPMAGRLARRARLCQGTLPAVAITSAVALAKLNRSK